MERDIKAAYDKLLASVMVSAAAAAVAALALPFLAQPAPVSRPCILASAVLQVAYYVLLAFAYRVADMGQAYPLMRGTAPLLVALASTAWFGEGLSAAAWAGGGPREGVQLALANAVVIAGYTLVDGIGVRRSGAPFSYTLWVFLLTGISLTAWALAVWRAAFLRCVGRYGHLGLVGGIATVASYGAALWAMTLAPVAVVAALRETSILFGAAMSALVLKEQISPARLAAAGIIAAGAMMLRLA